ncbi:DMT family transporter [Puniceicoccales bacterium CK1056]|uniref:DMT family transporter n=1 Tax=Oceanipulchritudo coccoides TaxID=2706888 RepID=A0A6B2M012_9BACT|nr:DMT family transporter [Oceanipulchritudo coccoides]NDV62043.1 DMT family transporter [Oceanipulchritudo coccoides]
MRFLILIFGVFCCSTSVIFIKIGSTDPIVLSAYRTLLGGILLIPFILQVKKTQRPPLKELLKRAWPPAFFLGIHFISWIIGARLTPSANASLIVNMVPVVMPILLLLVLHERISNVEALGTSVAILGVFLLGLVDFNLSPEHALGDAVCFLSMLFYAFYLIFARKNRDLSSVYLYVVPVYILSGLFCLGIAGTLELSGKPVVWLGPNIRNEVISILGLAIVPTVFGHSIINWALRTIRGQAVVIINLAQFIFAGLMGFILLAEIPHTIFYISSLLVVAGAIIVIRHAKTQS